MLRRSLAVAIAAASGPGRASSVGWTRTPPSESTSSPNEVRPKTSLTDSASTGRTSSPSRRSRAAASAGRSSAAAAGSATVGTSQTATPDGEAIRVWPKDSCACPDTWTVWPRATSVPGERTNTPSELAGSPSPASCREEPSRPGVSATTVPRRTTVWPASGVAAPVPWMAPIVRVGVASQVAAGGGGAGAGLTVPRVAAAGPCQTSEPLTTTRDSDWPSAVVVASATPRSVLASPAAGPPMAVKVPS